MASNENPDKSTYEYLNLRFGNATRMMAVIAFLIQTALYLGIVIYAPALALANTTGMDLWGAVVGTGLVCTLYTTLGGMKAVIWTSVFQVRDARTPTFGFCQGCPDRRPSLHLRERQSLCLQALPR